MVRKGGRAYLEGAGPISDKAVVRTRWYSGEVFNALTPVQFDQIEAWLKEKPAPIFRATPDSSYQTEPLADIAATLDPRAVTAVVGCGRFPRMRGDRPPALPDVFQIEKVPPHARG